MPPENWDGPDSTRPLLHKGLLQAKNIAGGLAAFGSERLIVSSPAVRCLATIAPLEEALAIRVKTSKRISQDAYQAQGISVHDTIQKRVKKRTPVVMCSHGPVIPQIVSAVAEVGHAGGGTHWQKVANLGAGSFSVIHLSAETEHPQIVAVETHEPPPTKN